MNGHAGSVHQWTKRPGGYPVEVLKKIVDFEASQK